ncbi:MAG: hypothetical protein ACI83Y_002541 [Candidatus Azotimanducaceae bacterium]
MWEEQAARPGLEAMKMRSRVSESEALLDPSGLGSFLVAEWGCRMGLQNGVVERGCRVDRSAGRE